MPVHPDAPRARKHHVLMVGFAGQQGREYLPTVRRHADVVGCVDLAPGAPERAAELGIPYFGSLDAACRQADFDVAVVTVPHHAHLDVCRQLLWHGKHVIKEKPFAVTESDARMLIQLAMAADRSVLTLLQRNYNPVFDFAWENLPKIGDTYWFSYDYHLNLARPTSGWRATREQALGGVLLDMGYHLLDVLSRMFPEPSHIQSAFVHAYEETRDRRLEDLVTLLCQYPDSFPVGSLRISRHNHRKSEHLSLLGTRGALSVRPDRAVLHSHGGGVLDTLSTTEPKSAVVDAMFADYFRRLDDRGYRATHFQRQLATVRTIDRIYRDRIGEQVVLADQHR